MPDNPLALQDQVRDAAASGDSLEIRGGLSKSFYGNPVNAEQVLNVADHQGIVNYQPRELVITARAGTTLAELRETLAEKQQMLAFEPPAFADSATLGGTIACGFSGPARPYLGSARDFVLGMRLINGRGELLHFGGEVMKNVAGYDVARFMTGSLGTLGVISEVSLKVLPLPESELHLVQEMSADEAIVQMNRWAATALPLTAACFDGNRLCLRLSGAQTAVRAAAKRIGGEDSQIGAGFWRDLNEQRTAFFASDRPLWRLSLPPTTPNLVFSGKQMIDWGGAQRWLVTTESAQLIRDRVTRRGGHATLFRGGDDAVARFQPVAAPLAGLFRQLKLAFDPAGLFNPGRLYPEF